MRYIKHLINKSLHVFGYEFVRVQPWKYLTDLLQAELDRSGELFFIQVGANDGVTADPLHQFTKRKHQGVRGVVIEPVREYFTQLQENYRGIENIAFKNVAIHASKSEASIYRVDAAKLHKLPSWAKGIASFDPDFHKHVDAVIPSEWIVSDTVPCMSFAELLDEYGVTRIDLLQIDTEGYDSELIKSIDFSRVKPSLIHFEHGMKSGTMSRDEFLAVAAILNQHQYHVALHPCDALAYQMDAVV